EDVGGIASFLAAELSPQSYLNLMDQYHPAYKVLRRPGAYPEIERRPTRDEYRAAVDAALAAGLERLDGLAL
ncbi:MAG: radical SAM protein, partial [Anaerolineae bacterium]